MNIPLALTYDDVLLVPQKSTVKSRQEVETTAKLTKNITLKIPLISANMDTVTESRMAIALAKNGGVGIIHRFCEIDTQVREVHKVKRQQNIIIENPFTIAPDKTLGQAKEQAEELSCTGFLVVDDQNRLLGIITRRDMIFCSDEQTPVKVLMTPKEKLITASSEITVEAAKELFKKYKIEKLPLVDEFFKVRGLITEKDIAVNSYDRNSAVDAKGRLLVGAAIGASDDFLERAKALLAAEVDVLVIDIAHGHSINAINAIGRVKEKFPPVEIIAGNVATSAGALDLIKAGADAIKVGIGPGSICTTRVTTGFGVPQLSAILNIAPVCQTYGVPLIADGGIRQPADLVKALAAGADTVMIGGQFAGTEEAPGPVISYRGRQYKISRGMASLTAALNRPKAKEQSQPITPEGIEARVPYRGPVKNILEQYLGGLRSGMSYGNARNLIELRKCQFIRITNAGLIESNSHDNEIL